MLNNFFTGKIWRFFLLYIAIVLLQYPANGRTYRSELNSRRPVSDNNGKIQGTFVRLINYLPKNYVKNGSVDYTSIIQNVLRDNRNVIFPNFPLMINDSGLKLSSNSSIKFEDGGMLILKASNRGDYSMIMIQDIENVRIDNMVLKGDRNNHKGTTGEWGMGISILGAKNVSIENSKISDLWGDGIYINKGTGSSQSVNITGSTIQRARRNGITVVSGSDIMIDNCRISESNGTLPMAGVCIEPNNNKDYIGRIKISNISTQSCNTAVHIALLRYPSNQARTINIELNGLVSRGDNYAILVGDFYRKEKYGNNARKLGGKVVLRNISMIDNKKDPIKYFNSKAGYEYGPAFVFEGMKIQNTRLKASYKTDAARQLKMRGFDITNFDRN